jgi:PAS domain S-box-containing protein
MNWVTIIWSMIAAACLTLAAVYLLVWFKQRKAWASLLFSSTAVAAAAMTFCELVMMRAETPLQFATALRWLHVPAFVVILSLVGFVLFYLRAGRPWLAWTVGTLRAISLLLDFLTGQNLNYRVVTGLRHIPFLGDSVAVGVGLPNPWMLVGQVSLVLFVVFVVDATLAVWRRGDRRQALVVGGSIVFFVLAVTVQAVLVLWQMIPMPITASFFYIGIVAAMAFEMSREALRAAELSDDLRASEARYRSIFDGAIEGIYRTSAQGKNMAANPALAKMLGYDAADDVVREVLDTTQQVWVDAEERDRFVRLLEQQEVVRGFECQFKRQDGTRLWVSLSSRAVRGPGGRVAYYDGFAEDITERKRAEESSRSAHDLMAAVFNSVPGLLYLYTEDGQLVQWNKKHEEMTGFTAEELLKRRARDWYDDEDLSTFDRAIRTIFSEGYADAEMKLIHKNGEKVPYFLTGSKVIIDGKPHLVGIAIDISERQKMAVALKESVERFRQVADIAGEFIWEVDAQGLYTYASSSVERIMGYTPEELIGQKHFYDLFEPSVREELKAAAFQAFSARQTIRDFPNPNVSKSGKLVHLETSGNPMLDAAGALIGYRGADTDVTERKQAEAEAHRSRAEIAHLSRVTMLGELSGSLAHELNQPLTAILSNAQAAQRFLAGDQPDLNELRDILHDIVADDQRAGEVISRLRRLLKQGEVTHLPLDLNEVVQDVLKLVRNDLLNHDIRLQAEFAPDLPAIEGDRVQLQQVLLNLIVNATEAMVTVGADDRRLRVLTERADADHVSVAVSDRGIGIPPAALGKIFDPFYTTKAGGMGLGLRVCRTIVEAHGGRIGAEPNADRGMTFRFTLPAAKQTGEGKK